MIKISNEVHMENIIIDFYRSKRRILTW